MLLCRQWSGLHEILSTLCLLLIWVALCMRPQKNRSPVSQHSWHDKDPFLIKGLSAERRPKFCNFSQPKMTSPYDRAKKTLQIIKAFSYRIDIVVQASNTLFAVKDIDNVSINIHKWFLLLGYFNNFNSPLLTKD